MIKSIMLRCNSKKCQTLHNSQYIKTFDNFDTLHMCHIT